MKSTFMHGLFGGPTSALGARYHFSLLQPVLEKGTRA